jgi:hypothetical protein
MKVATQRGNVDKAIDHFSDAWEVRGLLDFGGNKPLDRI